MRRKRLQMTVRNFRVVSRQNVPTVGIAKPERVEMGEAVNSSALFKGVGSSESSIRTDTNLVEIA